MKYKLKINTETVEYYTTRLGGKQNAFLREFLSKFKLA